MFSLMQFNMLHLKKTISIYIKGDAKIVIDGFHLEYRNLVD